MEEKKGINCASPKECFREGYRQGILEYEEKWIDFVDMRNETAHTYYEKTAKEIYQALPDTIGHFEKLLNSISQV